MIDLYSHVVTPPRVRMLGDVSDFSPAAWDAFLRGQRDAAKGAWNRAVRARSSLKKVRETLGLPFIVNAPGEAGAAGAWNSDFDANMLELQAIVAILTKVADEASAGKRALVFNSEKKDVGIELLPSDTLRVAVNAQGRPVVVDVKTNSPVTSFGGEISQLGALPPALIAAGVLSVVVVGIVAYAITEKICTTVENTARSKMVETVKVEGAKLVASGKATPEQVTAMDKALLEGTAAITTAEGKKAAEESQWASTIRTVAYVGLGIAGIWLVASLFGRGAGGMALAKAA